MSNADWYAAKFAGTNPPRQYTPPAYVPTYEEPRPQPTKARSARQTERCPDCDSENYFRPEPYAKLRCYDCGYPLVQSGTGMGSVADENTPARPARQVKTHGFNPQQFIGRIE